MKNREVIENLAKSYDSFYLYDEAVIREKANYLKDNFPGVKFLYSMKCNPNKSVLNTIFDEGFGADAASLGEVLKAEELGLEKNQIYYSAPGKMEKDLETALDKAVIIVDSMEEIHRIASIGERLGKTIEIGIRINPNFTLDGDECMFNKFGIDEEQVEEYLKDNQYPHLKITGIHVHLKSQELETDVMARYYKKMFELARKYVELLGNLEYVNLGSGMGVEYTLEDEAIDVEHLGGLVKSEMEAFKEANPNTQIMIETGRYVTCKSGVYVTKVIDRKVSCGKTILIIKNTLTGFARPCYEQVITRIGGVNAPSAEPLFTKASAFQFDTLKKGPLERASIFGNSCTFNDLVAIDIELPYLEHGDVIIMNNAGSYAAVITPMQFSSQEKPAEVFITKEGETVC